MYLELPSSQKFNMATCMAGFEEKSQGKDSDCTHYFAHILEFVYNKLT